MAEYQRSKLTEAICDLLRNANGPVSYKSICKVAGKPLEEIRQTLSNARRYLERDEGIVFATIKGEGLRRLSDSEKVQSAANFSRAIHRTAGRGLQRLDAVADVESLSNEDQMIATIRRTVFSAVKRETNLDKT